MHTKNNKEKGGKKKIHLKKQKTNYFKYRNLIFKWNLYIIKTKRNSRKKKKKNKKKNN